MKRSTWARWRLFKVPVGVRLCAVLMEVEGRGLGKDSWW